MHSPSFPPLYFVYSESPVFKNSTYNADWVALRCPALTDGIGNDFYQATWDYVQDTRSGMAKWGDIKTWDTSAVITMDSALSSGRDAAGNAITKCPADFPYAYRPPNLDLCCETSADPDKSKRGSSCSRGRICTKAPCYDFTDTGDNPKAAAFNTDILLWDTSQVTSMIRFLYGATAFNADVSAFDTSRVTSMSALFQEAQTFDGTSIKHTPSCRRCALHCIPHCAVFHQSRSAHSPNVAFTHILVFCPSFPPHQIQAIYRSGIRRVLRTWDTCSTTQRTSAAQASVCGIPRRRQPCLRCF